MQKTNKITRNICIIIYNVIVFCSTMLNNEQHFDLISFALPCAVYMLHEEWRPIIFFFSLYYSIHAHDSVFVNKYILSHFERWIHWTIEYWYVEQEITKKKKKKAEVRQKNIKYIERNIHNQWDHSNFSQSKFVVFSHL